MTTVITKKSRLAPPKNMRAVIVKSCSNCAYRVEIALERDNSAFDDTDFRCQRVGVDVADPQPWGDNIQLELSVCDGHKPQEKALA
jgi:hypothetical protein